jgi:malate dehydrogenase (oxaloacetate-decarboxylating)
MTATLVGPVPGHSHMLTHELVTALRSGQAPVPVRLRSVALLADPVLNKGSAFTAEERAAFGLHGLLPNRISGIEEQVALELEHVRRTSDDLERYIGLAALENRNETLFFRVLLEHLEELLPIVYTPTVGLACQQFSHLYRRPRGVWITPDDIDRIPELLRNAGREDVRLVVATDNERILGLGDQGAGGMPIPIGKLALYSAAAGIHPGFTLPVSIDVGTDRDALLDDPFYLGWRHPRLRGAAYDEVIEAFVEGLWEVHPRAVLQWEDFKQHNAIRLLDRYRDRVCSFNDDIQGTSAIALAAILAGLQAARIPLAGIRVVLAGSGAAGTGIARLLRVALGEAGMSPDAVRRSIAMVDSAGLVVEGRPGLDPDKVDGALPRAVVADLGLDPDVPASLAAVVSAMRPHVLVGTTGVAGAFDEGMIRAMAQGTDRPIILPLSNPTSNTEAAPADILRWTAGRAIVATGSPFEPVPTPEGLRRVSQANNAYVFPGIGLAAIVSEATRLPDSAFLVAARRLAELTAPEDLAAGILFPPIAELRQVAREIAIGVVEHLGEVGLGRRLSPSAAAGGVEAEMWQPAYVPYVAV